VKAGLQAKLELDTGEQDGKQAIRFSPVIGLEWRLQLNLN
jgi:hypothetical protein